MATKKQVKFVPLAVRVIEVTHQAIREAMAAENGNVTRAARLLDVSHRHLRRLLTDPALSDVEHAAGGRPRD